MMFYQGERWQNLEIGTNIYVLTECWNYFGRFMGIENGFLLLSGFRSGPTPPANVAPSTFKIKLPHIQSVNPIL